MGETKRASCPIKIKKDTKEDLDRIGNQIKAKLPFINSLTYDEIIWFLILNWWQGHNRGGAK